VVLKPGQLPADELKKTLREVVKKIMGPIVVIEDIFFVSKVPKSSSGKIMRRLIKAVVTDQPLGDYSTIEDATAIDEIKKASEELRK
jgi:acetyl-CoA synthetase